MPATPRLPRDPRPAKHNRELQGLSGEAQERLGAYSWPGNVRELESVIERAVVVARDAWIAVSDLPDNLTARPVMLSQGSRGEEEHLFTVPLGMPLAEIERLLIDRTLRVAKGNKTLAARLLGIDPKTIFRKLRQSETGPELEPPS